MKKIIIGVISSLVASMMIAPNIFAWQSVDEYLQTPGIVTNIAKEINSYPALSNKVNAIIDKVNNSVANKNSLDKAIIYEALSRKIQMFVAERGYDSDMLIYRVLAYLSWDFDSRAEQIRKELSGNDLDKLYEALNQLFQYEYSINNSPDLSLECWQPNEYDTVKVYDGDIFYTSKGNKTNFTCYLNIKDKDGDLNGIAISYEVDGIVNNLNNGELLKVAYGNSASTELSFGILEDSKIMVIGEAKDEAGNYIREEIMFYTKLLEEESNTPVLDLSCTRMDGNSRISEGDILKIDEGNYSEILCQASASDQDGDLKNVSIDYDVFPTYAIETEGTGYDGLSNQGNANINFSIKPERKVTIKAIAKDAKGNIAIKYLNFSTDLVPSINHLPEITSFECNLDNDTTAIYDIYDGETYYMDDHYSYQTKPEGIHINCIGKGYDADGDDFTMTISDQHEFVGDTYTGEGLVASSFLVKKDTGPFGYYKKTISIYDDKGIFVKSDSIGFYLYEGGKLYLEQENLGNQIIGLGSRDVEVLSMYVDGSNNGEYFLDDMLLYIGGEGDLRDIKTIDLYVNDVLYERSYPAAIVGNPDTLGMVSFRSLDASINPNTKIQIKVNFNESGKGNYYYFSTKGEYITIENQDYDEIDLSGEVRSGKYTLDIPVYLID